MSGEKPRYRVLRLSHIHNTLWPEGAEIEYEGGSALEPVNDAARQAKAKVAGKGVYGSNQHQNHQRCVR